MFRKALLSLFVALTFAATANADPVRLLLYAGAGTVLDEARTEFERRHGTGVIDFDVAGPDISSEQIGRADVILLIHLDESISVRLEADLRAAQHRGAVIAVTPIEFVPRQWSLVPDAEIAAKAQAYWTYGGVDNLVAMFSLLYTRAGGVTALPVPEPEPTAESGIYHPKSDRDFADLADYLRWYRQLGAVRPDAPLVGITFYQSSLRQHDVAHIDALIAELERLGLGAVPIFGWPFHTIERLMTVNGTSPLRLLLAFNLSILKPEDSSLLERLDIHALTCK
jgi:cobaltochelatase CobN